MSLGNKFVESEIKLSKIQTGALSRMSCCQTPGVTFARRFETCHRISILQTTPSIHGRHLLSDGDGEEKS